MNARKICSVDGCGKPSRSLGMCKPHYSRNQRWGNPAGKRGFYAPAGAPRQWLFDHILHEGDECLTWPFADRGNGYGAVSDENGKLAGAHREMCRLAHGEPPTPDMLACHTCGKGDEGCVNPNHLYWGTVAQNSEDMVAHGTALRGERNGFSKLTEQEVLAIDGLRGMMTQTEIGLMFGVSQAVVSKIHLRQAWSWLFEATKHTKGA